MPNPEEDSYVGKEAFRGDRNPCTQVYKQLPSYFEGILTNFYPNLKMNFSNGTERKNI